MKILFPGHPLRPGEVDPDFAEEFAAASAAGFACATIDHEYLTEDVERAVRRIKPGEGEAACWLRGWMVSGRQYSDLEAALLARGHRLIVDSAGYAEAHYLPLAYPILEGLTPESVWTDSPDEDGTWAAYHQLADGDVIVKDWVKSAKHRWEEACFIPARSSRDRVVKTISALRADRGSLFERGYVFRKFVPLITKGHDMRGHPVSDELRLFLFDGQVLVPPQTQFLPPADAMEDVGARARRFRSRLITLDVAPLTTGEWTIVESGDAGVSGLPVSMMADTFYNALAIAIALR